MTDDELKKKDWQVLTARLLISNRALLQSVIENQAVIISELKKLPLQEVTSKMNEFNSENYKLIMKKVIDNMPDYELIERKFQ